MPLIEITIAEGRAPDRLRELLQRVHVAVRDALAVPDDRIRVVVREIPKSHWLAGGVTLSEREAVQADEQKRG